MYSVKNIKVIKKDRYKKHINVKFLTAMDNKQNFFYICANKQVENAGHPTCDGCLAGNVYHTGVKEVKNFTKLFHLDGELVVGYPLCPFIEIYKTLLEKRY